MEAGCVAILVQVVCKVMSICPVSGRDGLVESSFLDPTVTRCVNVVSDVAVAAATVDASVGAGG